MDEREIVDLLKSLRRAGRDTLHVEVKRAQGGMPRTLHETLSAFANGDGGRIVLGVDEKSGFTVTGVDEPSAVLDQVVAASRAMSPPLTPEVEAVEVDGRWVVVADVPPIPRDRRPCHRASRPPWDASFIRMADGDQRLSSYEVQLLLENRSPSRTDQGAVVQGTVSDLAPDALGEFVRRIRDQRSVLAGRSDDEILRLLNVTVETDGAVRPTLAGLLAFGSYPQQHFPQLNVTVVVYPTAEPGQPGPRGERFLDNRSIDGSIPVMVRDTVAVLKRHMKQRSVVSGLVRIDEWEYPEEVLREALVNALVHRDYSSAAQGAQVQVELFPDRLAIRNPGGLFGPLRVRDLGVGTVPASSRNSALLKVLEDTALEPGRTVCENRGSGIVRMRAALTDAGMEPPSFEDDIATFTVTFPNHALLDEEALAWLGGLDLSGLSSSQVTALVLARRGEVLTNVGYRAATGVADSRTATAHLQELRRRGLLEQEGVRGQSTYRLRAALRETSARPSVEESVLRALGSTPLARAGVVAATGLTDRQVVAALSRLRAAGKVELIGKPRSRHAQWRRTGD